MMKVHRMLTMAVLTLVLAAPAASSVAAAGGSKLKVYTVNYPLQYFAERIGGDHVEVFFPGPAGEDARARIDRVFRQTGRPIVISSLAIAVGFAAFGLAAFRPTMTFGLLISATALSALACDLLLLPALALSVA